MMKIHIEATEAPHCTFSSRAWRKLTVFYVFFVFFNVAKFCQILTLFAQVMTSVLIMAGISAIGPKGVNRHYG